MKHLEQRSLLRTVLSGSIHLTDSPTKKPRQFNLPYFPRILPELIKKILNQSISELPYSILLYKPLNEIPSAQGIKLSGTLVYSGLTVCIRNTGVL